MNKPDIDLTHIIRWSSQFRPDVPDINRDGKITEADNNVACGWTCKQILKESGFNPPDSSGKVDAVVYGKDKALVKAPTWQEAVDTLHANCDAHAPTIVGVNRGAMNVGNLNPATNHYVVIVGRRYNIITGKYEYPFYDVGTHHQELGTHASQFFALDGRGIWSGASRYANAIYTITEVRRTA